MMVNYGEMASLSTLNKGVEEECQPEEEAQIILEPINLYSSLHSWLKVYMVKEGECAKVLPSVGCLSFPLARKKLGVQKVFWPSL